MDLPHGFGGHTTVWLEICTDLVRDLLQGSGEQNGENLHALCLCLSVYGILQRRSQNSGRRKDGNFLGRAVAGFTR